ncbi:Ig-like domain-containing protein [Pseudomonas fluorescens]|uniref:Ig-like domain-containing protein n=1 Tax=Pseudomonas fluorescens TaxID=294 RepID=UPI001CD43AAB
MGTSSLGIPEILVPAENSDQGPRPTFIGKGDEAGDITVEKSDGTPVGTAKVLSSGQWQVTSQTAWIPGAYAVRARQTVGGNHSPWTALRNFTVT